MKAGVEQCAFGTLGSVPIWGRKSFLDSLDTDLSAAQIQFPKAGMVAITLLSLPFHQQEMRSHGPFATGFSK